MAAPLVLISGLGLMGGSLAAALTAAGWPVLLHHHRALVAQEAEQRGWGRAVATVAEAAAADLAVVCTPVGVIPATVRAIAAASGALITDVGSTKAGLCAELADLGPRFIGSHPMCGSHRQGLAHADAQLYRDRVALITPTASTRAEDLARITALWHAVGSRILHLSPEQHDRVVAEASHLPHVLASLTASLLSDEAVPAAAGGFRDATRIAGASPDLWLDILRANRAAISPLLARAQQRLADLQHLLASDDGPAIRAWLASGRAGRQRYEDGQES